ncbi:MAG: NAD(P)/FAD-dependent oxidoreductase [Candidatus Aenigmarchaeota archaeon]|nr:NAD(P)/FAD-dependent oxidoreductase [Candidatus Aenigmarchaeota archaeon]
MDVVIVGAGPSGCIASELIAKKGYEVLVVEEHKEIGKPVQCTGLVSERIGKIPREIILNKVRRARFFCFGKSFEISSREKVFVIEREKYDKFRAEEAEEAGARFKLNTRFFDFKNSKVITTQGKYQTKILIGADGPNSTVAKVSGLELPNNLFYALQVNAYGNFEKDCVELWFSSKISKDFFAWVVPEREDVARIGLITRENPAICLEEFLEKRIGKTKIEKKLGDTIRIGLIKKSVADNVLLIGDAACQIKPFSAGGLIYGKIGAECAAKACIKALEEKDFSEKFFLENYEKKWKKKLALPIRKGLILKKVFSCFSKNKLLFETFLNLKLYNLAYFLNMDLLGKD